MSMLSFSNYSLHRYKILSMWDTNFDWEPQFSQKVARYLPSAIKRLVKQKPKEKAAVFKSSVSTGNKGPPGVQLQRCERKN